jgi:hypothetical protein
MMMDDLRPVASPRVERIQGIIHLYLRSLAIVLLLLGLMHWMVILGVFVSPAWRFEVMPINWQGATIVLAVGNLVAGVGLWMRVAWGVVVWVAAAVFEIVIHVGFTAYFGLNPLIVGFHIVTLGAYGALFIALRRAGARR